MSDRQQWMDTETQLVVDVEVVAQMRDARVRVVYPPQLAATVTPIPLRTSAVILGRALGRGATHEVPEATV